MADDLHDSYRSLQLEAGASLPAVKRAYRQLVKMWHPDHFAPGSKMELKAQEKLKEINQAYERLCKSRGQNAASDADASGPNRKARKSASPSEEETKNPRRTSSKKAEEDPEGPPAAKGHSRKMGEVADDAPADKAPVAPEAEAEAEKPAPPQPVRRAFGFWSDAKSRRRILLAAAVLAAAAVIAAVLPRGFWGGRLASGSAPAPSLPSLSPATASASSTAAFADQDKSVAPASSSVPPAAAPASALVSASTDKPVAGSVSPGRPVAAAAPAENPASSATPAGAGVSVGQTGLSGAAVVAKADSLAPGTSSGARVGRGSSSAFANVAADATAGASAPAEAISSFTVGSSKAEVVEIQGQPDSFTATRFQYGSSEVFFRNGRVESWQDGNPRLKARKPADLSASSLETFTIGSRKDEVVAVQGKPDAATDTTYRYGSSVVIFLHDRVESWRDGSPHLKTRTLPSETVSKLATFTIGSRKDEVVEVQGLPERFTETTFQYGSSTVFFENGRVVSWVNGEPPLKAKKPWVK